MKAYNGDFWKGSEYDFITYLRENTDYDLDWLRNRGLNKLREMTKNISTDGMKYQAEIIRYQQENPDYVGIVDESIIRKMKYKEISNLRKKMIIDKVMRLINEHPELPEKYTSLTRQSLAYERVSDISAKLNKIRAYICEQEKKKVVNVEPVKVETLQSVKENIETIKENVNTEVVEAVSFLDEKTQEEVARYGEGQLTLFDENGILLKDGYREIGTNQILKRQC